jgi:hypothetical protein
MLKHSNARGERQRRVCGEGRLTRRFQPKEAAERELLCGAIHVESPVFGGSRTELFSRLDE